MKSCRAAISLPKLRVKEFSQANPNVELIRLGIGDVTRPLAPAVVEAFEKAVREMGEASTFHGYGPDYGYDFLVNAIIENDYRALGVEVAFDEVFVSDGAKCDVSNVQELFSDDAVIAVTDPVYPVYVDSNAMAGRAGTYVNDRWDRLCYLPCNAENGFVPPLPDRPVDVIYLCYPNNPTGTTLTREQLKAFVDYARRNGCIIVYDAAYKAFITSGAPRSIYEVEGAREVAIECCSFSKTAGFTGTRCGYTIVPQALAGGKLNKEGYKSVAKQLMDQFGFEKVAITLRTSISASDNDWAGMLYDGKDFCFSKEYHLRIVDRVGGGDSFGGGLIYALLNGKSTQDAIEFAVAASALKHSIEGDFNRVTVSEVEKLAGGDGSGRVQR